MKAILYKNRYLIGMLVFAVFLFFLIFSVFSIEDSTNRMIVEYAGNLGWQLNPSPAEISHLTIPKKLDDVFECYNKIQKKSGFDISPFCGKRVTRYVYSLQNHSSAEEVFFGVLVYESRIIAGDIFSSSDGGFIHEITEISKIKK